MRNLVGIEPTLTDDKKTVCYDSPFTSPVILKFECN